ncbi:4Fe-4S binding protein [Clostridium estertheticum]|uniref:[Fe-Fe] hydrogenase large subunit C-terminal domain-containing protein n=1 Tax=Clostridium estertheticum TaxID=238834 RepID=UPI001C7D7F8B|nr:[Fe-Fe] hydrogenase large subunit C-terminal domain-containing protein [Clostridium estertheticum]MBX4261773.1 4Fe-4S binding protein [Clostridium estertheticum]WLC70089.1 4Fe-4S binding protein [Clostridium estertheticum]
MNKMYNKLFKALIKSYNEDNFENKVHELLSKDDVNKKDLSAIISSLCGVNVDFSLNYIEDLKKAISTYETNHKVVNKIKGCTMNCSDNPGKTSCQASCPFDAILIDNKTKSSYIDNDKCTECGFCVEACPSGALMDKVEFIPLLNLLKGNSTVIAAVAPAITGQFGENVNVDNLRTAFKKIGFTDMVEVAFFADMLTIKEAVEFDEHVKTKEDLMLTSCCCPMWVGMVKRVYNDLVKYVSPSVSPMIASGRVLKKLNPNCKVVFIGPCIAKKGEAKEKDLLGDIDYVLTFAELKDIFETLSIDPEKLEEDVSTEYASRGGRLYARTGGVSIAVGEMIEKLFPQKHHLLNAIQGNGVKECKVLLTKAQTKEVDANFIEGMGCVGGCVGGPKALIDSTSGRNRVNKFAENSKIKTSIDSDCMKDILSRIGINTIDDFKDKEKTKIFGREF